MHSFLNKPAAALSFAAFICITLYITGIACRPLFPVDETRYLTVAWEMIARQDWLLPHLNGAPYDHKPPLLFWSINLIWALFGIGTKQAMAVPFLYAFAFLSLTYRFAHKIRPGDDMFSLLSVLLLAGSLPFILYSNMIMFDLMLGVFTLLGLTATWDYAKTGERKHLVIFALAVGLGALAKGPAILLHLIFPVLLVRYWNKDGAVISRKEWALGFLAAIIAGTLIGLAWAIPAAIKGGPEFAQKIFWGQTAGRITKSFDHEHPFWWYIPFLPALMIPWIASPLLWRGFKKVRDMGPDSFVRFAAVWLIPVFIVFSFISGKQVHYLIPLLPGLSLLLSLCAVKAAESFRARDIIPCFIVTSILMCIPLISTVFGEILHIREDNIFSHKMIGVHSLPSTIITISLFIIICAAMIYACRKSLPACLMIIATSMLMALMAFQLAARDNLFKRYELTPVASVIQKNPDAPLAFARNYHGEWGYLARLQQGHNVKQLDLKLLPSWFEQNPNGMALIRTGHPEEIAPFDVIFSMPYKTGDTYNVVVPQGRALNYSK